MRMKAYHRHCHSILLLQQQTQATGITQHPSMAPSDTLQKSGKPASLCCLIVALNDEGTVEYVPTEPQAH